MDWSNEAVLKFLKLYQMHRCIWDPKDKFHRNRAHIAVAWNDIMNNIGIKCTIPQLKKKKESLMSAYRAYKSKVKRSLSTGTSEVYQPTWYAFSSMDSFLASIYESHPSLDTENDSQENKDTACENIDDTNSEHKFDKFIQGVTTMQEEIIQKESPQQKIKLIKRKTDPLELQDAKRKMDQARHNDDENDECDLFTKFLNKKLRKLTEERRDYVMYKINKLLYEESYSRSNTSTNIMASPNYIEPSPNYQETPSYMYVNDESMQSSVTDIK